MPPAMRAIGKLGLKKSIAGQSSVVAGNAWLRLHTSGHTARKGDATLHGIFLDKPLRLGVAKFLGFLQVLQSGGLVALQALGKTEE